MAMAKLRQKGMTLEAGKQVSTHMWLQTTVTSNEINLNLGTELKHCPYWKQKTFFF